MNTFMNKLVKFTNDAKYIKKKGKKEKTKRFKYDKSGWPRIQVWTSDRSYSLSRTESPASILGHSTITCRSASKLFKVPFFPFNKKIIHPSHN